MAREELTGAAADYLCVWCGEEVREATAWNANGWPCCSEQCMEAELGEATTSHEQGRCGGDPATCYQCCRAEA